MADSRAGMGRYKMSLDHLVMPEVKKRPRKMRGCNKSTQASSKRLLLAKSETSLSSTAIKNSNPLDKTGIYEPMLIIIRW